MIGRQHAQTFTPKKASFIPKRPIVTLRPDPGPSAKIKTLSPSSIPFVEPAKAPPIHPSGAPPYVKFHPCRCLAVYVILIACRKEMFQSLVPKSANQRITRSTYLASASLALIRFYLLRLYQEAIALPPKAKPTSRRHQSLTLLLPPAHNRLRLPVLPNPKKKPVAGPIINLVSS